MSRIEATEALWASSILPEGLVERWLVSNGAVVSEGEAVVEIRVEDALHEVIAPATGRLLIVAFANDVIEPGSLLGRIANT